MKTLWMIVWIALGVYCVIAAIGGGGGFAAIGSMLSGFMVARNISDVVSSP